MKKGLLIAAFAATTGLAMLAPVAHADDGNIGFNGSVGAATCTIQGGGGTTPDFTVTLPNISAQSLSTVGSSAGRTLFQIKLTNCNPTTGQAMAYFEPGPTVDNTTNALTLGGGAAGVEIFLLNDKFQQILVGQPQGVQNSTIATITGGNATITFYAQYQAISEPVTPGAANTSVQYTMLYQ
jgi:major type 1 subunit fimbrin (pilin)